MAYKIVNCREEALVLVAFAPLQIVPGTYWMVVTVAAFVTVAAVAVTVVGGVMKLKLASALTPEPAVVRSVANAGNAPF